MDTKDKKIQEGERERKRQNTHTLSCKCPIHKNKALHMRMPQWRGKVSFFFRAEGHKKKVSSGPWAVGNSNREFPPPAERPSELWERKAGLSSWEGKLCFQLMHLWQAAPLPEGLWSHFSLKKPSSHLFGEPWGWWWMGWSTGQPMMLGQEDEFGKGCGGRVVSARGVPNLLWASKIIHPGWRDQNPHPAPFLASWESLLGGKWSAKKPSSHPAWSSLPQALLCPPHLEAPPDQPPSLKISKGQLYQQKNKFKKIKKKGKKVWI